MSPAAGEILTIDRSVAQVSAVPAIIGEATRLFVREKVRSSLLDAHGGKVLEANVVLMIHGGYWPSTVAFDLPYAPPHGVENGDAPYSWMEALALNGFDVFAMDMTGTGGSSRPMMDDPGNLSPESQATMIPRTLLAVREPSYPYRLATSDSEAADIDRVVDAIRELRGVARVNLIGWSGGGIRTGTYAVRHPEKVARLVIWASSNYADDGPDSPPANLPEPGYPMRFQDRATGEGVRWRPNVRRAGQVEPGVMDVVWQQTYLSDPVGASWGPGGLRGPTRTYWGWNAGAAGTITAPTLVMAGEYDRLMASNRDLHRALGAKEKVFIAIDGASHFMTWEKQRRVLHAASAAWLRSDGIKGRAEGIFRADYDGTITAEEDVV